ncbi:hypothetical protein [Lentzea sp. E54]
MAPDRASASSVDGWVEAALDALERVVASECRTKRAVHQPAL